MENYHVKVTIRSKNITLQTGRCPVEGPSTRSRVTVNDHNLSQIVVVHLVHFSCIGSLERAGPPGTNCLVFLQVVLPHHLHWTVRALVPSNHKLPIQMLLNFLCRLKSCIWTTSALELLSRRSGLNHEGGQKRITSLWLMKNLYRIAAKLWRKS